MKNSTIRLLTLTSAFAVVGSPSFAYENTEVKDEDDKVLPQTQLLAFDASNTSGGNLFTQEQIDASKKEAEKKDSPKNIITTGGIVQFNLNTSSTTRANTPDFSANKVRLGVQVASGIASGQVELQFDGSQSGVGDGEVTIRRAQLNLDLLTMKNSSGAYTTTLSLGGIRVGGADNMGGDATWATTGNGRTDGVYLKETLEFHKTAKIELGAGFSNNMSVTAYKPQSAGFPGWADPSVNVGMPSSWMSPSLNKSRAILAHIRTNYSFTDDQTFNFATYYAKQNKSPVTQTPNNMLSTVRDLERIEMSGVYNHSGIFGDKGVLSANGVGVWFEQNKAARTQTAVPNNDGDYIYTNTSVNDTTRNTLLGVGLAGDTAHYFSSLAQKGDRLTYGISYALGDLSYDDQAYSKRYNVSQFVSSVGYGVSSFEMALNVEYSGATAQVFTNSKGMLTNKNAAKTYLTAAYAF
jgi:hypothetical protein